MNTDAIRLEPLSATSIPHNVALARSVGWPDDEADWRLIHEAAFVLGAFRAGELVGQGMLSSYAPNAGTIGKMIVSPSAQRQGIGAAILDALLAEAERRGTSTLGLVATPFGEPLYASRGFCTTGNVAVFIGTPRLDHAAELIPAVLDIEQAIELERRYVACSRASMLRGRHRDACVTALSVTPDSAPRGFALVTRKDEYALVGPVFAENEQVARSLLRAVLAVNSGPVRIDVPAQCTAFRSWLTSLGLAEKGLRPEMARGGDLPWQVPQRFALATQAWG